MNNIYGTKKLKEMPIRGQEIFAKIFVNSWSKFDNLNIYDIKNKNILVFDFYPMANYLSPENKVTYLSTSEKMTKEFKEKHASNVKCVSFNNIEELKQKLNKYLKTGTMNYIIGNPPYDKDLYLKICEVLLPYLTEDGTLNIIGPSQWITMGCGHQYRKVHQDLYNKLIGFELIDPDKYEHFENFLGITRVGVMRFSKNGKQDTESNNNIWKEHEDKDVVSLVEKIKSSKCKKLSDVIVKNASFGTYVPLGDVGGYSKKYVVYSDLICVHNGECYVKKNGEITKIPVLKYEGEGLNKGKAARAVMMKSLDQAIRWHDKYKSNVILKGFAGLSLFKGTHFHYDYVYYLPFDKEMTNEEISKELNLNENNIEVLRKFAKTQTLEGRYKFDKMATVTNSIF